MAKTHTVQEMQQRLAKHIRSTIIKYADGIEDLAKREQFKENLRKASLFEDAHPEPGVHEPAAVGVEQHMEPGAHEQFQLNPPAQPDAATAEPIVGGTGIAPGQLDPMGAPGQSHQPPGDAAPTPGGPQAVPANGDDMCPLCGNVDQPGSCTCLNDMMLGKKELNKNALMGYPGGAGNGQAPGSSPSGAIGAGMAMSTPASPAMGTGMSQGASAGIAPQAGMPMQMSEADGKTNDPSKKQPFAKQPDAKLPPEAGKVVPQPGSGGKPKANSPFGKAAVPEAKPPSGKVPGATAQPAMASNTSKPGIAKSMDPKRNAGTDGSYGEASEHGAKAPGFNSAANTEIKGYNAPTHPEPQAQNAGPQHAAPVDFAHQDKQHWIHALTAHMQSRRMGKTEPLGKAVLAPPKVQMQQHAAMDASKQAAGAVAPPASPKANLTHPSNMDRANSHAAALGGAFQPKGQVTSGLQTAKPMAPAPTMAKPAMPTLPKPAGPFGKSQK